MSFFSKLRSKIKSRSSGSTSSKDNNNTGSNSDSEQRFSIQPHPAKTNDPNDPSHTGPVVGQPVVQPGSGGINPNPLDQGAFHTPGPFIPSEEVRKNVEAPATRDELRARAAELNRPE